MDIFTILFIGFSLGVVFTILALGIMQLAAEHFRNKRKLR